jgi:hypothetical protein
MVLFFFFGGTELWMQGLMLARQVLLKLHYFYETLGHLVVDLVILRQFF